MIPGSKKYITLKEAAEISGYAPDYIGQLIRQGKLPGRQVYLNLAWTTTEEALRGYMAQKQVGASGGFGSIAKKAAEAERRFVSKFNPEKMLRPLLYGSIGLGVSFAILIFYIFSVSLDSKIEQRALRNVRAVVSEDVAETPLGF